MRRYQIGAQTKTDLTGHLLWIPQYRKRVLTGQVAVRARDRVRQSAVEHELESITGKVASEHVHMFIQYKPHQDISKIVQWLQGISARGRLPEVAHLRKQFWGRHLWARGYFCCSSGNVTDEIVAEYIANQNVSEGADEDFKVDG